ncbi:amidohydrolase family protein [Paenibacillus sacheonensis]|uniref:Amidohydrolase family protein n=1 Tax=Paenibacillus sacheonensis TaxID=742054 RepID=A0A7X4YLU3_9BACL|nr:amidohydrolase family protein [Paenibacillus sacheonensis]MBM7566021.1 cytosine deaminase [Paenibacillus sacheonensis]NBC68667.1 amidohydrolase family protein [Paenibacillus sacheonensis]
MTNEWKLINVSLPLRDESHLYALTIRDGIWTEITAQPAAADLPGAVPIDEATGNAAGGTVIDLGGNVLLPGLVDAHMHLDKAFSLPQVGNVSGTLDEAVNNYANAVHAFSKEEIKARIIRSALQAVSYGTTAIRTHLDYHVRWGAEVALRTIEAALEAQAELAPYVKLELFPLAPMFRFAPGDLNILEETLRMGVTGVGTAAHMSQTAEADIDKLFEFAAKFDMPLDFHTDESDDPNMRTVSHIARRTIDYEWSGRVTVDHLCSLAAMNDMDAGMLIEQMAAAKLHAVTLPGANLYLQGRRDSFPVRRGVTRVKELLAAGITLATASDNIHDPFHPFGRGDLLQIGLITAYAAHMGRPADLRTILRMMTEIPAAILRLEGYGVEVGNDADFVVFDGSTPEELFTMVPERRWVFRGGGWLKLAAGRRGFQLPELDRKLKGAAEKLAFGTPAAASRA